MPRLRRAQLAHVTFCEPNKKEEWQSSPGQDLKSPPSMQAKHKTSRRLLIRAARLSWSQETFPSPPIEQHSHLQLPNLKAGWMTARYQLEICPKARLSLTFTTLLCLLRGIGTSNYWKTSQSRRQTSLLLFRFPEVPSPQPACPSSTAPAPPAAEPALQ